MRTPLALAVYAAVIAGASIGTATVGASLAASALTALPRAALPGAGVAKTSIGQSSEAAGIETSHPAEYYKLAARLFAAGKKDEAVFWMYAGQIRFRAYLATHPDLARDAEPALFASLSESVGRPINEYAFGNIPSLAETLDRVLAWDRAHADPFSPKGGARDRVVDGLRKMKLDIVATADDIRANRARNGLANR